MCKKMGALNALWTSSRDFNSFAISGIILFTLREVESVRHDKPLWLGVRTYASKSTVPSGACSPSSSLSLACVGVCPGGTRPG
jgi:hypothetical protein